MKTELNKTVEVLKNGGIILYPTDTVWGIGCDATNTIAIEKIYKIKNRSETKSMIILVEDIKRLSNYVENVPNEAIELINNSVKPLTIIYPKAKNLPKNLISSDGSVAIRVVKHKFCEEIIKLIDKPLVSTSANISGEVTPLFFTDISKDIKNQVDYIVGMYQESITLNKPSTIIRFIDDFNFELIRE